MDDELEIELQKLNKGVKKENARDIIFKYHKRLIAFYLPFCKSKTEFYMGLSDALNEYGVKTNPANVKVYFNDAVKSSGSSDIFNGKFWR